MQAKTVHGIEGIFPYLPKRITEQLQKLPPNRLSEIAELRLRANLPLMLVTAKENLFLSTSGRETTLLRNGLLTVQPSEIEETVAKACGYSVHSHQSDFVNGCISLPGGHRIGLCGTAVTEGNAVIGIRTVTALNVRIAKPFSDAAKDVLAQCYPNRLENVLLVGPPMSGKTTVLRALAQCLSDGQHGKLYKCAVVDEHAELFACASEENAPCFADILSGYPKAEGIRLAVHTLSPDIIFCDEIGSAKDVIAIADGMRCGVHFAVTAHAGSVCELLHRTYLKSLFTPGGIDSIVLLGCGAEIGKIQDIQRFGARYAETGGSFAHRNILQSDRDAVVCASA